MSDPLSEPLKAAGINASAFDKIQFARGVIGKATYVAAAAVLALGVIGFSLRDPTYLIADAALIVVLFVVYFAGALWFANKHPGLSLLEGAELIQWRQMEMAAKDLPASKIGREPPQDLIGER